MLKHVAQNQIALSLQGKTASSKILPWRFLSGEEKLEEAITFLVQALASKPKKGKKPVALHSLRVGFYLMRAGYSEDAVIAGILHDILEKSSYTEAQLARRFSPNIAAIVAAVTNNSKIDSPLQRYAESVRRCKRLGGCALLVRAADLIDNCDRLLVQGEDQRLPRLADKLRLLIKVCRDEGIDPLMVEELSKRHRRIARRLASISLVARKSS